MHSGDPMLWLTFLLVGAATALPRSSFIVAGQRVRLPSVLQRALRYAPAAALAALIAPDLLLVSGQVQLFSPKFIAAIGVTATVLWFRNPWLPFLVGMALLLAQRFWL